MAIATVFRSAAILPDITGHYRVNFVKAQGGVWSEEAIDDYIKLAALPTKAIQVATDRDLERVLQGENHYQGYASSPGDLETAVLPGPWLMDNGEPVK